MAAGRELKRATAKIREEQRRRNREAREEADARQSELERRAELSPSEIRAEDERRRAERRAATRIERDGHRVKGSGVKGDFAPGSDKMDRGGADSSKGGLDAIAWGSKTAKKVAEEEDLTVEDFARSSISPSGERGYLTGDVRKIAAENSGG